VRWCYASDKVGATITFGMNGGGAANRFPSGVSDTTITRRDQNRPYDLSNWQSTWELVEYVSDSEE
jgi:hypothetical protein